MAKGKKTFQIETPRGTITTYSYGGGKTKSVLKWNDGFGPKYEKRLGNAQEYVDQECIRRMAPETPFRSGALKKSPTLGTVIGSGEINQISPYARRQYYEHKQKSRWFERMKNRHKGSILEGARKIASR